MRRTGPEPAEYELRDRKEKDFLFLRHPVVGAELSSQN